MILELRIVLPFSLEEFRNGHLFTRYKYRKSSEDVSVTHQNQSIYYTTESQEAKLPSSTSSLSADGLFTHMTHTFPSLLPTWAIGILGSSTVRLESKTWDEYPYILNTLEVPATRLVSISVETLHVDSDLGMQSNAFGLSRQELVQRSVSHLDIAAPFHPTPSPKQGAGVPLVSPEEDPKTFVSKKCGRGPLFPGWQSVLSTPLSTQTGILPTSSTSSLFHNPPTPSSSPSPLPSSPHPTSSSQPPFMCVYVLIRVDVNLFAVRQKAESYICGKLAHAQLSYHRLSYLWIDDWLGMSQSEALKYHVSDPSKPAHVTLVPSKPLFFRPPQSLTSPVSASPSSLSNSERHGDGLSNKPDYPQLRQMGPGKLFKPLRSLL